MPEDTLQKSQMPQASTMPVFSVRQPRLLWATSSHRILGLSVASTKKGRVPLTRQRVHCNSTTAISTMVMREDDRFVDFKAFKAAIPQRAHQIQHAVSKSDLSRNIFVCARQAAPSEFM